MKSSKLFARPLALLAASTVLILAGCGQKGPLYRPVVPPDPFGVPAQAPKAADKAKVQSKDDAAGDKAVAKDGVDGKDGATAK